MLRNLKFSVVCVISVLCLACTQDKGPVEAKSHGEQNNFRAAQLFNDSWAFVKSDEVLSLESIESIADWQSVSLPHSPNIEPRIVNDQWQGDAWYKKEFKRDQAWQGKLIKLDFEGAMNAAQVWINGTLIKEHQGGYLPFTVELSDHLQESNTLLVRLDNRDNPITGPKPLEVLDFNMYGGIYRNVWLRVENPVHISDAVNANIVAGGGIKVSYPSVSETKAELLVKTHVINEFDATALTVRHSLYDDKKLILSVEKLYSGAQESSFHDTQSLIVDTPALWSPSNPALYDLVTEIVVDSNIMDIETTRIGIREFKIVNNELLINGKKHFLRGVNRHQEYPYIGYALSDAAQYRDAEKIKAAGFDYVRLSHYPHSKAFMRAADELGLVLLDAILGWQYIGDHPQFESHALQTCRDMIRRDRNHASVLAWECSLNESAMPESLIEQFNTIVHEELPGVNVYSAGWTETGYDIYLQARQHRVGHYKEPVLPYIVSEYGDWEYYAMNAGLNQDSWADLKQADRSSRQLLSAGETRLQQQAFNIMEAHNDNFNTPAFADGYWVMFDYNRGYADDIESSGIMSLDRLPKFSYYFYQSQRDADQYAGPLTSGYMAHIASYWQHNSALKFHVYSNAERVELLLNGNKIQDGVADTRFANLSHPPFLFELEDFEAGSLEAHAYVGDKLVASHRVFSPAEPAQLALSINQSSKAIELGVNDLVFVYANILDVSGNPTRENAIPVTFSVEGELELISPVTIDSEAGIAAALLRVGSSLDGARVNASFSVDGKVLSSSLNLQ